MGRCLRPSPSAARGSFHRRAAGLVCAHCVAVGPTVLGRAEAISRQRAAARTRASGLEAWLTARSRDELLAPVREQAAGDRELRQRLELRAAAARSAAGSVRPHRSAAGSGPGPGTPTRRSAGRPWPSPTPSPATPSPPGRNAPWNCAATMARRTRAVPVGRSHDRYGTWSRPPASYHAIRRVRPRPPRRAPPRTPDSPTLPPPAVSRSPPRRVRTGSVRSRGIALLTVTSDYQFTGMV